MPVKRRSCSAAFASIVDLDRFKLSMNRIIVLPVIRADVGKDLSGTQIHSTFAREIINAF